MSILELDEAHDSLEPVSAACSDTHLVVMLSDGREIRTPLWWYPRLLEASVQDRAHYELSPFGIHWPDIDEDLSVAGMLKGRKAPGAVPPA